MCPSPSGGSTGGCPISQCAVPGGRALPATLTLAPGIEVPAGASSVAPEAMGPAGCWSRAAPGLRAPGKEAGELRNEG